MSRQVMVLETGRDKKETHLISLKQADGAFSWAARREDGKINPREEAF